MKPDILLMFALMKDQGHSTQLINYIEERFSIVITRNVAGKVLKDFHNSGYTEIVATDNQKNVVYKATTKGRGWMVQQITVTIEFIQTYISEFLL